MATLSSVRTGLDLATLFGAGDWASFLDHYRRRQPLVRADAAVTPRFAGLWREWQVEAICRLTATARYEEFRLFRGGRQLPRAGVIDRAGKFQYEAYRQLVAQGASLSLGAFDGYSDVALDLCRALEAATGCPVQVNLYITPPGNQGLGAHVDSHDVLVLQLRGEKAWDVYREPQPGGAYDEVALRTGSWLYLPKGTRHEVRNRGTETSVHFTVGFHPLTWGELIERALKRARVQGPRLNDVVPPGVVPPPDAAADAARWGEIAGSLDLAAESARYYAGFPHLARRVACVSLDAVERIESATHLRWVDDASLVTGKSGGLELVLPYRRYPLPLAEHVAPTVQGLCALKAFTPDDARLPEGVAAVLVCRFLASVGAVELEP